MGIALPVTEVLTLRIPSFVYQAFYVYLYTVSILFVIFVYTAHMRTRAVFSLIKTYRESAFAFIIRIDDSHSIAISFYFRYVEYPQMKKRTTITR